MTTFELANITIGRLRRRILKLQQQREHWKTEYQRIRDIFDTFPMYESSYETRQKHRKLVETHRELTRRVAEQSALIQRLLREANLRDN